MRVLKFGGSSLATPDRIRDVGRIVVNTLNGTPAVVVVSAFQGVTNQLIDCARLAERRDPAHEQAYDKIAARHRSAVDSLLGRHHGRRVRALVDDQLGELRDALHGIRLLGHCPPAALDVAATRFRCRKARIGLTSSFTRVRRWPSVPTRRASPTAISIRTVIL